MAFVVFNLLAAAALIGIDQAIKLWATNVLQPIGAMPLIPHVVELRFVLNPGMAFSLLNSIPMDELADLMIVSQVELVKGEGGAASAVEGLGVAAAHATGEKCERCWKYSSSIGSHAAHPTLCARCASVVEA